MTRTELTSQLLLFMLFSGTSSGYVAAAWNRAQSHMRLASTELVTPARCYRPGVSKPRPAGQMRLSKPFHPWNGSVKP